MCVHSTPHLWLLLLLSLALKVSCHHGPSRSTASICRGQPTLRRSPPSGMLGAASWWKSSGRGCFRERSVSWMILRILQMWWADSCAARTAGARGANSQRQRAQKTVCPRRLRQLSATAMALWVVYSNHCKNRVQFWINLELFFPSSHTCIAPSKWPLSVILMHFVFSLCLVSFLSFYLFACVFQSDLEKDLNWTLSELEAEALMKSDESQVGKHTMTVSKFPTTYSDTRYTAKKSPHLSFSWIQKPGKINIWDSFDTIFLSLCYTSYHTSTCLFSFPNLFPSLSITGQIPRIILTHPSTSDEDVELLTQNPSREPLHDFDIPDRRAHSDCSDSAFYPPWPQPRRLHMKDTDCYYPALCFFWALKHFQWPYCEGLVLECVFLLSLQSFFELLLIVFGDIKIICKDVQL